MVGEVELKQGQRLSKKCTAEHVKVDRKLWKTVVLTVAQVYSSDITSVIVSFMIVHLFSDK